DTCQAGVCTGANPVVCTALDQCHVAGTCDPATGTCSNPAATDGTACSDANACIRRASCRGRVWNAADPVGCNGGGQGHSGGGAGDPPTGQGENPTPPEGAT